MPKSMLGVASAGGWISELSNCICSDGSESAVSCAGAGASTVTGVNAVSEDLSSEEFMV